MVAVEDDRYALGRVAVLVQIGADRGDPWDGQVPLLGDVSERAQKRQDEPAQAGVDVAEDAAFQCQGAEFGDRVDHALGVGGGRADHEDGVVVDGVGHGVDVCAPVSADRHPS